MQLPFCCVIILQQQTFYKKEHLSFVREKAHLNKMKSGHMGNDKALIQRIELGKDNFDVELKYSTTRIVVYDLVPVDI